MNRLRVGIARLGRARFGDLDEVAACVVEDCCRRRPQVDRFLREADAELRRRSNSDATSSTANDVKGMSSRMSASLNGFTAG